MGSNTTLLGCEGRGLPPPVCVSGASGAVCGREGRRCVCSNANEHVGCVRAGAVSRHPMTARSCETNVRTVMLSHSVYAPLAEATTGRARDVIRVRKRNEHAERFEKMGQNTVIEQDTKSSNTVVTSGRDAENGEGVKSKVRWRWR